MRCRVGLALAVVVSLVRNAAGDGTPTLIALTEDDALLVFAADRPASVRRLPVTGASAGLVGLDVRPADGRLYALSSANDLYRVDPATGRCTLVSTLTTPFGGGVRSGVDFTPQADRLRLLGADGQNLRVHVGLGATAADAPLAYRKDDPNAGRRPEIAAAAYTNAVAGAATTRLFAIDAGLDVLVLQEPPNDGVLTTIGPLGVDFAPLAGFDIVTRDGIDRAWAASGGQLYTVDLERGRATAAGAIGDGAPVVVALAAALP
jgi:hypothetical protein